jgi:HAD superfamily hydrolase (TIGR01509 family)
MKLTRPGGVILDLDGTLVDTVPARIAAWVAALAEGGIYAPAPAVAMRIGMDGPQLAREIAKEGGCVIDSRTSRAIDQRASAIFSGLNLLPQPLPGARELIRWLRERRLPWAIATSSHPAQADRSLLQLAVAPLPIVSAADVKVAKPAPDMLLLAARRLGVDAAGCWAIGDSRWDVIAARAAGMTAVVVAAGSAVGSDQLAAAGPDAILPNLLSLKRLIEDARDD